MIDYPGIKSEALKKRYNQWAGNPLGDAYDENFCAYEVQDKISGKFYQCSRKNGKGPGGLYCGIHANKIREFSK